MKKLLGDILDLLAHKAHALHVLENNDRLNILKLFADQPGVWIAVQQVMDATGLPRTTAHQHIRALQVEGLVNKESGRGKQGRYCIDEEGLRRLTGITKPLGSAM